MARGLVVIKRANSLWFSLLNQGRRTRSLPVVVVMLVTSGVLRMFPGTLYIQSLALRAHTHAHKHKEHSVARTPTQLTSMQLTPTRSLHTHSLHPRSLRPRSLHPHSLTPTRLTFSRDSVVADSINTHTCIAQSKRAPMRKEKIKKRDERGKSSRINWTGETLSWIAQR